MYVFYLKFSLHKVLKTMTKGKNFKNLIETCTCIKIMKMNKMNVHVSYLELCLD